MNRNRLSSTMLLLRKACRLHVVPGPVLALFLALSLGLWAGTFAEAGTRATTGSLRPRRSTVRRAVPAPRLVYHVETQDGREVDSLLGDEPINPASVTKVATSLWALERLGPDYRFETRVLAGGPIDLSARELAGDLVFEGQGDPDFQDENGILVAQELNRLGIRRVRGRLVVNRWFWTGWEGGSAHRDADPAQRALQMATRMEQLLDSNRWTRGMREAWRELARKRGFDVSRPPRVTVLGNRAQTIRPAGELLLTHRSQPLRQILHRLNAFSNNDIERIGDVLGGADDMSAWLNERWKMTPGTVRFATTSGLGENRITPRQVVGMLRDLQQVCQKDGMELADVLSAAGCVPGTVSRFYQRISNGPAQATVVGKTGTLTSTDGGVSVFAGFASTVEGDLIFCVAAPRAAGRLRSARSKAETFVLDLVDRHGGPVTKSCGAELTGPDDGADLLLAEGRQWAPPDLPEPSPAAARSGKKTNRKIRH